jgi:hypothetical protein
MLMVSLLARISSTTHHSSPGIPTAAILVAFVLVTLARYRLRSRGFNMRIGGRNSEDANPFSQSGATVNQIDRTL